MTHTPGPWTTFNGTDIFPDDNDTSGSVQIADCSMSDNISVEDKMANALLIAAAPDMFEALRHVAVLGHGKCTIGKPLADMIRSALIKAIGEKK